MLRRNIRERKEYLYRKGLEGKERDEYERKRKIRQAIEEGAAIPTELREDALRLKADAQYEDASTQRIHDVIDDEYARAGIQDPKIFITTSREPSSRLLQFAKEVKLIFPNAQRINRGNHQTREIVNACRKNGVTDLVIVHEHRGEPDGLIVCHFPYGPTAYFGLVNCVMRHDIKDKKTVSEVYPHLIFNNFSTKLGLRVENILKYLFPVPKYDSKRVITFSNENDFISFRHHTYRKEGKSTVELKEIGPRFEMKLYQVRLGTVDQDEAETEWVLRPYMNTAKRRKAL
mmetsp:Transcript_53076/g.133422  ORF Transcript_53076/g.133422 Transcript_53076/m.133422 type:complete len:288 (-) Transcript_53076:229-1092(-)|eukprot:CAMPEP_0177639112 /NCGR_PEP_ID=MMETSP0447-20121125/5849_1 /TAXON_ID=0 /ORGANISM="Stygamoeba regulata, Strain BSH-02190019" /LENGTH=287 /DNA_ID=CAMNT_0019141121 /DNA_START=200 /DNA_END=1063 /DNA_ORIENTATION=+